MGYGGFRLWYVVSREETNPPQASVLHMGTQYLLYRTDNRRLAAHVCCCWPAIKKVYNKYCNIYTYVKTQLLRTTEDIRRQTTHFKFFLLYEVAS